MMKNILFVFYTLDAGGAERSLIEIGNKLSEEEYRIDFFVYKKSNTLKKIVSPKINIIEINAFWQNDFIEKVHQYFLFGYKLKNLLKQKQFDSIIAVHEQLPEIALRFAKIFEFKLRKTNFAQLVLFVHISSEYLIRNRKNFVKKYFQKYLAVNRINRFDKIIFVSDELLNEHKRFWKNKQYDVEKIKVINNSINFEKCYVLSDEIESISNKNYFVCLGSIKEIKGQKYILESLLNCVQNIEFEIYFIGRIVEDSYYQNMIKLLQNSKKSLKVRFLGEVKNPFPFIKHSLGLINASEYESFSYAVHEAMLFKIPIISKKYDDQTFINETNVVIFSTQEQLSEYLISIYNGKLDYGELINKAFEYVTNFDINYAISKIKKHLTI